MMHRVSLSILFIQEIEKYQQEGVEDRPRTPKFPVVPEVQLRKSNSFKPSRGSSRSNTIHIVQAPEQNQKDICISAPLKLTWGNSGLCEIMEKGAVIYRNGILEIQNDSNKNRVQMKMSSTMKSNRIWEFSNPEECIKVSVDKQYQITMGSPRQRRKSVEEDTPKNLNKQNILIKLLRRRSDKQLLEKKGIFKNEDIFGNKLSVLYESSRSEVPEFVRRAVELIEYEKNIKSEHIYRLSGNMATIQKIRLKIDGRNYKVLEDYKNDVDVLTGCLKLFYRELVEPLIPYKTFEEINKLTSKPPGPDRDKSVKSAIKNMKTPHRENLLYLIQHLLMVESYKQHNKMTVQSLSIVWGPSLLWYPGAEKCTSYAPYEFSMLVNGVLELILTVYQADSQIDLRNQAKNDSRGVSWKDLDTISEEGAKKSPSGSSSSKWLFGLRKSDSKDKLTASNWSLSDLKKDKSSEGYLGKPLESLPKSELYPNVHVPKLFVQMTELIEKNPQISGLYIKTTNKDVLGKFKKKKNKADVVKMDPLDVAVILLKLLQDLETPLVPRTIYEDFVANFDKTDDRQKILLVRHDIENLNQERKDTIQHLVNHILKILDNQDDENRENICNAWLPIFCNTSVITVYSSKFVKVVLGIDETRRNLVKELPTFSLPLKKNFEHKFHFKNADGMVKSIYRKKSDSSVEENRNKDLDKIELYTRSNSADVDIIKSDFSSAATMMYKNSVSIDDARKPTEIVGASTKSDITVIDSPKKNVDKTGTLTKGSTVFDSTKRDIDKIEAGIKNYNNSVANVDITRTLTKGNTIFDSTKRDIDKIEAGIKNYNSVASNVKKDVDKFGLIGKSNNPVVEEPIKNADYEAGAVIKGSDIFNDTREDIEKRGLNIRNNNNPITDNAKKDVNRPGLFIKNNNSNIDNTRRDISKVGLSLRNNLSKIVSGQTLENARARAEMLAQKKT